MVCIDLETKPSNLLLCGGREGLGGDFKEPLSTFSYGLRNTGTVKRLLLAQEG